MGGCFDHCRGAVGGSDKRCDDVSPLCISPLLSVSLQSSFWLKNSSKHTKGRFHLVRVPQCYNNMTTPILSWGFQRYPFPMVVIAIDGGHSFRKTGKLLEMQSDVRKFCSKEITRRVLHLDLHVSSPQIAAIWTPICRLIQECFPGLKSVLVDMNMEQKPGIQTWEILFEHLPTDLSKLAIALGTIPIRGSTETLPFLHIGSSFPHLLELTLRYHLVCFGRSLSLESCKDLAQAVKALPLLKVLCVRHVPMENPEESSKHLVDVIRRKASLVRVDFDGGYKLLDPLQAREERLRGQDVDTMGYLSLRRHRLDEESVEALQFGPRIQQAKLHLNQEDARDSTIEQWVKAISSVRDRLDCLDYLFSSMDPTLYAPAAIAALRKN